MKKLMAAAALLVFAFAAPAYAYDMAKCDDASLMAIQTHMDGMTDPAMKEHKEMAMKEMEMAKTAMKDGKMDDCTAHMRKANTEMMKK